MISVTYHAFFLGNEYEHLPKSMVITTEQLDYQIRHLKNLHQFYHPNDIILSIEKTGVPPPNAVVLTFDDAHLGQATVAERVLNQHDIKGFFFAPTCIINDRILPTVEKQRLLQYFRTDYSLFYNGFCEKLREFCPDIEPILYLPSETAISSALDYYAEYKFYSPLERLYRKVRETIIPTDKFDTIINLMFGEIFNEQEIVDSYYMNWEHLKQLKKNGHEIGGHGHLHLLETSIDPEMAINDAAHCLDLLSTNLQYKPRTYAYPYGIFKKETEEYLKQKGIQISFTCREGIGMEYSPLRMDRLDCQNLPFDLSAPITHWSINEMA
ncbi:polysaccharide deacetylase family protein [Legionella bononiensis]|uniref:Polysaccharide deacetylase family protein n=1 Tax=Legionella bononiensis TaxID=2793102 RepID=A0ABS1W7X7_9GAMM|nr:polysaccharide deacetylase family protein [Legionella bononiensis]MBL7480024.1 polysaccharide deacetylase family protein [Legionella bononiensis]MBL7525462.1 polysaccharide deacetylase family protein [Legionella bononiensis]MBL7561645.1 polysaccharide deacetylase family protein [Legionella bononiensis]